MKNFALIFSLFFFLTSCTSIETKPMKITPLKNDKSVHVGQGIWMKIPSNYKKAKSYEGFQTADNTSSISVKINLKSMDQVKKIYSSESLSRNKLDLLQLSPVNYDGNENAIFSLVEDTKKKTIKYLLAINDKGTTYNLKAFCFASHKDKYDDIIREALFSSVIGEVKFEEKLFKPVIDLDSKNIVYTKDGKYPTDSPDQSKIEVENVKTLKGIKGIKGVTKVEKALMEFKTGSGSLVNSKPIGNGELISGRSIGNNGIAYVALISLDGDNGLLVKCSGNAKSKISEFEDFVINNFFKTKLIRGF
jgi:hypothetical protein